MTGTDDQDWLRRFHDGSADVLEACYRIHFDEVARAVGRHLCPADRDNVVHDVFCRLISQPELRKNFQGGNFAAWLTRVASNAARDLWRKRSREEPLDPDYDATADSGPGDAEQEAQLLVDRFRNERLPRELHPLFEARFVRQLSQREAARSLGMRRSTLAYQEEKIRVSLRKFLIEEAP